MPAPQNKFLFNEHSVKSVTSRADMTNLLSIIRVNRVLDVVIGLRQ